MNNRQFVGRGLSLHLRKKPDAVALATSASESWDVLYILLARGAAACGCALLSASGCALLGASGLRTAATSAV